MRNAIGFIIFIGVFLSIVTGWHWYVGSRLLAWLQPPAPWALRLRIAVLACGYGVIVSRMLERLAPPLFRITWWMAAIWFGFAFILFMCLLGGHVVEWGIRIAGRWPGDVARRYTIGAPATLAVILSVIALVQGLRAPTVVNIEVPIAGLPSAAEGLTIVQISDTHIGAIRGVGWTRSVVEQVNALEPDIIAVTGDLVDERADGLGRFEHALSDLKAPHGVYAITGNHEYISGVRQAIAMMSRTGMRVLENEAVEPVPGLRLVGLHDRAGGGFGMDGDMLTDEQLAGLVRSDRPTILLYHQPVRVDQFASLGVDLMLSGHTHEGQIWPFGPIERIFYPHLCGRHQIGTMALYVTTGTGTWGPPMRLGTRNELVLVTLRQK